MEQSVYLYGDDTSSKDCIWCGQLATVTGEQTDSFSAENQAITTSSVIRKSLKR